MTKWVDRYADWVVSRERLLVVKGAQAARGLWTLGLVRFIIGISALLTAASEIEPWETLAFGVIGLYVGHAALSPAVKAGAFRNGWLSGRADLMRRIHESETPSEFVVSVLDYDMVHVMGLGVETPDSPEGLED